MQSIGSLAAWGRLSVAVLFILGPTFYFGLTANAAKMGIMAAAGAAAVMLLHFDRLKSLKLGMMEAQLKEKIEEATATLAAFQDLAAETLAFGVEQITGQGRLSGDDDVSKRDARVSRLRDVAHRMGVDIDPRVREAVRQHHVMMAFDLCNRIRDGYATEVQRALIDLMAKRTILPTREKILAVFTEHDVTELHAATLPLLDEYVEYCYLHALALPLARIGAESVR